MYPHVWIETSSKLCDPWLHSPAKQCLSSSIPVWPWHLPWAPLDGVLDVTQIRINNCFSPKFRLPLRSDVAVVDPFHQPLQPMRKFKIHLSIYPSIIVNPSYRRWCHQPWINAEQRLYAAREPWLGDTSRKKLNSSRSQIAPSLVGNLFSSDCGNGDLNSDGIWRNPIWLIHMSRCPPLYDQLCMTTSPYATLKWHPNNLIVTLRPTFHDFVCSHSHTRNAQVHLINPKWWCPFQNDLGTWNNMSLSTMWGLKS